MVKMGGVVVAQLVRLVASKIKGHLFESSHRYHHFVCIEKSQRNKKLVILD